MHGSSTQIIIGNQRPGLHGGHREDGGEHIHVGEGAPGLVPQSLAVKIGLEN